MPNLHKIEIEAECLRKQNDALLVLIIKPDWGFIATDPRMATKDVVETLRNEIPNVQSYLERKRAGR
jgi:hypothetical protein